MMESLMWLSYTGDNYESDRDERERGSQHVYWRVDNLFNAAIVTRANRIRFRLMQVSWNNLDFESKLFHET